MNKPWRFTAKQIRRAGSLEYRPWKSVYRYYSRCYRRTLRQQQKHQTALQQNYWQDDAIYPVEQHGKRTGFVSWHFW